MEYSLLKQIVPNRSYFPLGISTHPTHFPGFDCVNPGIGNVTSPYSYFVPSHFQANPNLHVKQQPKQLIEPVEQEGKGSESPELSKNDKISEIPEIESDNGSEETEKILNLLNARKKKLLDTAIYESFLHPKKIKTETLHLKASAQKTKVSKVSKAEQEKNMKLNNSQASSLKHKFKFE